MIGLFCWARSHRLQHEIDYWGVRMVFTVLVNCMRLYLELYNTKWEMSSLEQMLVKGCNQKIARDHNSYPLNLNSFDFLSSPPVITQSAAQADDLDTRRDAAASNLRTPSNGCSLHSLTGEGNIF